MGEAWRPEFGVEKCDGPLPRCVLVRRVELRRMLMLVSEEGVFEAGSVTCSREIVYCLRMSVVEAHSFPLFLVIMPTGLSE